MDSSAIYQQVKDEFRCDHAHQEARLCTFSNGTTHVRVQCLTCGTHVGDLKKCSFTPEQLDTLPEYDRELLTRRQERRNARWHELLAEARSPVRVADDDDEDEDAAFRAWYEGEYLQSPPWKKLRYAVMKRANWTCEGCGERRATQVHHLTYEHVGCEFLWELRAVCDKCHQAVHEGRRGFPPAKLARRMKEA